MKLRTLSYCVALSILAWNSAAQAAPASRYTARERAQAATARAVEKFHLGQFDLAEKQLRASLQIANNVYDTHFWLGRTLATRAGSSPAARNAAVAAFRRAIELQPYGEDGETARAWLTRIVGRPKTIRFFVAQPRNTPSPNRAQQELQLSSSATQEVLQWLSGAALAEGFRNDISEERSFAFHTASPDDLAARCRNEQGLLSVGWLVGVACDNGTTSYQQESGYTANTMGQVWIFDPLARQTYGPYKISGTSANLLSALLGLKTTNSSEAHKQARSDLARAAWSHSKQIVAAQVSSTLLDEVQFPVLLDGVYARSAAPYQQATRLPLVALTPCSTLDGTDDAVAREIAASLGTSLLKPKRLSLITPGNMQDALVSLGYDDKTRNDRTFLEAGRRAGSRYVVVPHLKDFDLKVRRILGISRITAKVALQVKVLDCERGNIVFDKLFEKSDKATKISTDKDVDGLLKKRALILEQALAEATTSIQALPGL